MTYKTLVTILMFMALSVAFIANADRQSAELPKHVSKHLMSTMRDNLEVLEQITQLLSQQQYIEAADMAEKHIGMTSMEIHYQRTVGKYMPKGMREMSKQMHQAASDFATTAREAEKEKNLSKALAALSPVMKQCVACHDSYRAK